MNLIKATVIKKYALKVKPYLLHTSIKLPTVSVILVKRSSRYYTINMSFISKFSNHIFLHETNVAYQSLNHYFHNNQMDKHSILNMED